MSLLVWVHATIKVPYNKESIINILEYSEKFGCKYFELETDTALPNNEAAELAINSNDIKWVGGLLFMKTYEINDSFGIGFSSNENNMLISIRAFDYRAKGPLFYEYYGADYTPYLDLLLKLTEPYVILSIDVGSM